MLDSSKDSNPLEGVSLLLVDSTDPNSAKHWSDYFPKDSVWSGMLIPTDNPEGPLNLTPSARLRLKHSSRGLLIVYVHWSAVSSNASTAESKAAKFLRFVEELRSTYALDCVFLAVSDGGLRDETVETPAGLHLRLMRAAFPADGRQSPVAALHQKGFEEHLAVPLAALVREGRGGDTAAVTRLLARFDLYLVNAESTEGTDLLPPSASSALSDKDKYYQAYLAFCALAVAKRAGLAKPHPLFGHVFWRGLLTDNDQLLTKFPELRVLNDPGEFPQVIELLAAQPAKPRALADRLLALARSP